MASFGDVASKKGMKAKKVKKSPDTKHRLPALAQREPGCHNYGEITVELSAAFIGP